MGLERWIGVLGLVLAALLPALTALRWVIRLEARVVADARAAESRVSSHEKICDERYLNLAERHSEVIRLLGLMRDDMQKSTERIHDRLDMLPVKPTR